MTMMSNQKLNPESKFDRWEFIETHLPGYHQSDEVAWALDLAKYIDGEFDYFDEIDRDHINEIAEVCPTIMDALIESERIECELYLEALKHYRLICSQTNEQA